MNSDDLEMGIQRYTLKTSDTDRIKRAIMADSLALVLMDFDNELRAEEKHAVNTHHQAQAERWRDCLRDIAARYGVFIDDLYH